MVAAIVLAGGSPTADELLQALGVEAKSLIKIRDKEMVRYVVDALVGSGQVNRLVVVGLQHGSVPELVPAAFPVEFIPNQVGLVANALAGVESLMDQDRILISSADIPLLTSEIFTDFLNECARWDADIYYPIVERAVMEARFPSSGRSYRPLRDGYFAGGDLLLVNPRIATANRALMSQLASARKSGLRLVRLFGFKMIIKYLTRRLSIAEAERKANEVLQCRCKAVITKHPEIGMDVDKMHQFRIVQAVLEGATI